MFSYMERDTDRTAVWVAKGDFNINLMSFHVLAKTHISPILLRVSTIGPSE